MRKLSVSEKLLKKKNSSDMLLLKRLELSRKKLKSRELLRRLRRDMMRRRRTERRSMKERRLKLRGRGRRRLLDRKRHSKRRLKLERPQWLLQAQLLNIMLKSGNHNSWLKKSTFKMIADNILSLRNAKLPAILKRLRKLKSPNLKSIFFKKRERSLHRTLKMQALKKELPLKDKRSINL